MNPSGEQVELAFGEQRAVLVSVGAGLRTYSVGERPILDGYGAGEVCPSGHGQLLVPWPNRIEDGRYDFDGRAFQVPLNEPARRNAIHGLVRWSHGCACRPSPCWWPTSAACRWAAPPSPTRAWTSARPGRSGPRGSTTASPASTATAAAGPLRVSAGRRSGSTRPSAT